VLSVRFISRQHQRDPGNDKQEIIDTDQKLDDSTANDTAADSAAAAPDDDDIGTPGQVDWIVVTSHADNTIRFRTAKV